MLATGDAFMKRDSTDLILSSTKEKLVVRPSEKETEKEKTQQQPNFKKQE